MSLGNMNMEHLPLPRHRDVPPLRHVSNAMHTAPGWADFRLWGGRVDTALCLDPLPTKKKAQVTGLPNPTETDPWAPEVTRNQNSAKNENGSFGISVWRGFRKVCPQRWQIRCALRWPGNPPISSANYLPARGKWGLGSGSWAFLLA